MIFWYVTDSMIKGGSIMNNKKKMLIAMGVVVLILIICYYGVVNRTIVISEKYQDLLSNVDYIEVVNGSSGEKLTFENKKDIDIIVEAFNKVILNYDLSQVPRGDDYRIKCYDKKHKDRWVELIIGGSKLRDNNSSNSPYYKIEGEESMIRVLDNYYDEKE